MQAALASELDCSSGKLLGLCSFFIKKKKKHVPSLVLLHQEKASELTRLHTGVCSTFLVYLFIFYFFYKESHSECVAVSTVTTCHITITIAAFRWQLRLFNHRFPPSCPSQAGLQATASTGRAVGGWRGGGGGQSTVGFAGRKKKISCSHGREAWELLSLSDRSQPAA